MMRCILLLVLLGACRSGTMKNPDQQKDLEIWAESTFGKPVGVSMNPTKTYAIIKRLMSGAGHRDQLLPFWIVRLPEKTTVTSGQFTNGLIEWKSDQEVAYLAPRSPDKVMTEPELTIINIKELH